MIAFLVVIAPLIGATGAADDGVPFFTRPEPSLEAAFEALSADDPDVAIERIHDAEASDDDERAIVEFDVGQALIARARKDLQDAAAKDPKGQAQQQKEQQKQPQKAPQPPKLDDAIQSFERAATLAKNPRITSEAHLATGNASLEMQQIDDAIAAYRRAVVADLSNDRARRNLQRVLELKNQQPPPQEQQQSGDGKSDDQKKQDGDKKDGEQGDQQQKQDGDKQGDDRQKDGDKKEDDAKNDDDKDADGDKNDQAKKDDPKDKKDGQPDSSSAEEQKKKEEQAKKAAAAAKKKPTSKEEAKRLLQGLRSRERPLSPLEMRGEETQRPKDGKDW